LSAHAPLQEFKAIHEVSVNTLVDEIQSEVTNVETIVVNDKKFIMACNHCDGNTSGTLMLKPSAQIHQKREK